MLTAEPKYLIPAGIAFAIVLAVDIIKEFKKDISIRDTIAKWGYTLQTIVIVFLIIGIILYGSYGPGYTAQDFIYMQF